MKAQLSPPIAQKLRQDTKPFAMRPPSRGERRNSGQESFSGISSPATRRSLVSAGKPKVLFPNSPGHGKKTSSIAGVVTGETSAHFLVRFRSSYVPVRKSIFQESGHPLRLSDVKGRKVQITGLDTANPSVHFLVPDADLFLLAAQLESDTSFVTTERDNPYPAEDELERQTTLNLGLLHDIVALTSLSFNEERSKNYAKSRLPELKEELKGPFSTLSGSETGEEAEATCKHLLASLEYCLSSSSVVCSDCKTAASRVQLSCSHCLCSDCCKELIMYTSGSELKLLRCPSCMRGLTTTDARLILLERYHILKKGLKYAEAFGVETRT